MLKTTLRAAALLALVAAVAAPVAVAAPSPAPAPPPAAITASVLKGEGRLDYPVRDQEVRVAATN
ncbi:hypothetical protein [Streptomyces purpureus]|uniref:Uncharacterized protein n=1 Tax=Streptomyces purpureus TaxID=1951 RepID=A0A918LQJ4_9ACTN|nr:hypothetical protein [Streptomyces purpureus]GGT35945.1 hypothetical protein GCM10014713_31920 [Streptomyces purpureus]